jgi:hypothetical protein
MDIDTTEKIIRFRGNARMKTKFDEIVAFRYSTFCQNVSCVSSEG